MNRAGQEIVVSDGAERAGCPAGADPVGASGPGLKARTPECRRLCHSRGTGAGRDRLLLPASFFFARLHHELLANWDLPLFSFLLLGLPVQQA